MAHGALNTGSDSGSPFLPKSHFALGIAAILLAALLAGLTIYQLGPTAATTLDAPALEFSAGRALDHIKAIAGKPRPPGTAEHQEARDYLLNQLTAAGLTPEVQRTTGTNYRGNGVLRAGTVENVIARLKGASNTKPVLLMAHYDSVPTGFGASDDGSGVAVLLETLRALKAGPPSNNDVIFLFTDCEEPGLLGAHAFVDEHPWAKEVGLVLNFEARGSSGPSILFETSEQNGKLIEEFSKATPHPVASSFAYEIYRLLPNNTDLTVFKDAGLPGLNFAYIDNSTHYHNELDRIEELDPNSLQHQGNYALALTKHFANLDLVNVRKRNAVYFDVLGVFIVRYSGAVVPFLTVLITVLFLGLVISGSRKRRFSTPGLGLGFVVQLLTLIILPAVLALAWMVMRAMLDLLGRSAQAAAYQSKLYFIGFALLAIGLAYIPHAALLSKIRVENFMASSLAWWIVLLILATLFLPGVTYLLTWPVLFCLPGFAYLLLTTDRKALPLILFFLLALTPALLLLAPAIYLASIGLSLDSIGTLTAILVLVCILLLPHFLLLRLGNDRVFATVIALAGVVFIGFAALRSTHDARHPKLDSLFYGLNANNGKAIWASFDKKPDEWTSRVLSGKAQKGAPEFFAPGRVGLLLQADAVPVSLPVPNATVLTDSTKDSIRTLKLRITSPRGAPVIAVYLDSVKNLQRLWVNGKRIEVEAPASQRTGSWSINYFNAASEGIELTVELSSAESLKIRVVDQSYNLPDLAESTLGKRPDAIIPSAVIYNGATVVSKSFSY